MRELMRFFGLLGAVLSLCTMPSGALAQDVEQGDAQAFIVTPLSFQKELDLEFGTVIPSNTPGTVVMDSAGNVSTSGGVIQIDGTQQPARFAGFGAFNQTVLINVDATSYILTRNGGTQTILMDTLLIGSRPPIIINTNPRRFRIANPAGFFFFTMAGRLQVPANAIPGTYEGEFTVTLEYE
ncbi:MAG: DUF4402 domain-containing protein [Pseudomonadota bacterium]